MKQKFQIILLGFENLADFSIKSQFHVFKVLTSGKARCLTFLYVLDIIFLYIYIFFWERTVVEMF